MTVALTTNEIVALVDEQLALITEDCVSSQIRSLLVSPRQEQRPWDYGQSGETRICWIVLEHRPSSTAIAYCRDGFVDPWGILSLQPAHSSMGIDGSWFAFLEDAFRSSSAWKGVNPPGYEVR